MAQKRELDFKWAVDSDYSTSRDSCTCDGICRCGKITNFRIKEVDLHKVAKFIIEECYPKASAMTKYCIYRLCVSNKLYDPNRYNGDIGSGYYGEELYAIHLENSEALQEMDKISTLKSINEKLEYVLKREYGYILAALKGKKWEIKDVDVSSIDVGNPDHYRRLDTNIYDERYLELGIPICVCLKTGNRYRLIDGYNRFYCIADEMKTISVLTTKR